ncbi:MAG: hypothetical protein QHI48_07405 [Bacteroidota bacterium]|nr:hypothetical protein [Bacteroidota bacterium]
MKENRIGPETLPLHGGDDAFRPSPFLTHPSRLPHLGVVLLVTALLMTCYADAQTFHHSPSRSASVVQMLGATWIGTSEGLFQYRPLERVWSMRAEESGLISHVVTCLFTDEDMLWVGTDRGVTRYDPRSNSMHGWDSTNGIPPGRVLCFAAERDYIWVGTESGAARFDKLIEQWQTLDRKRGLVGRTVFAVQVRGNSVYIVTDSAVNEYDPRYERWRVYREEFVSLPYRDAFCTGTAFWMFKDDEAVRFDPETKRFHRFPLHSIGRAEAVKTVFIEGSSFYLETAENLWRYDDQAEGFRPFTQRGNIPDPEIQAVGMTSGNDIWFASISGLAHYVDRNGTDGKGASWTYFTHAGGLPSIEWIHLFPVGSSLIAFSPREICIYMTDEARWYTYPLPSAREAYTTTDERGKTEAPVLDIDTRQGTVFKFSNGWKLDFTGSRASWFIQEPFGRSAHVAKNFDLKAGIDLLGGRSLTASYNDIDFSDLQYGARYRGAETDIVQDIEAGDFRIESGTRELLQPVGIFGYGARIVFGKRTAQYRRPFVEIQARGGHRTTAKVTETFLGKNTAKSGSFFSTQFRRKEFFRLDSLQRNIRPDEGSFSLYLEHLPSDAATHNVIEHSSIAGYVADWTVCRPVRDYTLDTEHGIVRVLVPIGSRVLATRFRVEGAIREITLSLPSGSPYEMWNVYSLGARDIIPSSFVLVTPLEDIWGLDGDGDGRIDPEYIDYKNGFLRFPVPRPFPPDTYSDTAGTGTRIAYGFSTTTASFALRNTRLIRGSEQITVDGRPIKAGDDYVLDYTSGTLSFIREGVIFDESRIEITYEYVENDPDHLVARASITVSPSDDFHAAVTTGYSDEPAAFDRPRTQTRFLHASGDFRFKGETADFRLSPEIAHTWAQHASPGGGQYSESGNAVKLAASASTGPLRCTLGVMKLDTGYTELFPRDYAGGGIRTIGYFETEIDLHEDLRLFGTWRGRGSSFSWSFDERVVETGVKWFGGRRPFVTIRYTHRSEDFVPRFSGMPLFRDERGSGDALRADVQFTASPDVLAFAGFASAKADSYIRYAIERNTLLPVIPAEPVSYDSLVTWNVFLRLNVSPRPLFTITTYYRGDSRGILQQGGSPIPFTSIQRLFVDAVAEHITGLSLTVRYTDDLRTLHTSAPTKEWNSDERRNVRFGARFSPGVLIPQARDVTLEFNASHDDGTYRIRGYSPVPLFLSHFSKRDGSIDERSTNVSLESKVEWKPGPGFLSVTTARFLEATVLLHSSRTLDRRREMFQRLDIHGMRTALYSFQVGCVEGTNAWSDFLRFLPSLWTEQRWGDRILTRFTLIGTHETSHRGEDFSRSQEIQPSISVTFLLHELDYLPDLDIRYDASFRYGETLSDPSPQGPPRRDIVHKVSNSLSIDVYPFRSSYVRFVLASDIAWFSPSSTKTSTLSSQIQSVIQL